MLKFRRFEDNRITFLKSIGSLGFCHTENEKSTRELPLDRAIILQASVYSKYTSAFGTRRFNKKKTIRN
jgi:hypothetical protein